MESPHSSRPVSAHINWCPFPPPINLFDGYLIPIYVQSLQSIAMLFLVALMTEVGYEYIFLSIFPCVSDFGSHFKISWSYCNADVPI